MSLQYKGESWLNKKVGDYTIIGLGEKVKYPSQTHPVETWIVKCDCGNQKQISKWHLIYGNVSGCSECYGKRMRFQESANWNSQAKNVTGMYYHKIKKCAEKRGLEFCLSREDLDEIFEKQNGKCKYLNEHLFFECSGKKGNASLDRIDSSRGYTKDNVQWVHKDVNVIKWDLPHDRFIKICKTISENFDD